MDQRLLQPVQSHSAELRDELFEAAITHVFDLPTQDGVAKRLLFHVCNRDLLWKPCDYEGDVGVVLDILAPLNYFQWLSAETDYCPPMMTVFSYLFERSDPMYRDPYTLNEEEKKLRCTVHEYLRAKYALPKDYLKEVTRRAWCKAHRLTGEPTYAVGDPNQAELRRAWKIREQPSL
jgi:hypothetical protein